MQVKGKIQSYSGVSLQDLPVKYTVKRSAYNLWRISGAVQIASGEVTANENGEFTIPVRLEESDEYKNNDRVYYRYSIEATVTNVAGETQSSTDVIPAGNCSLVLQMELDKKTCKDRPFDIVFKAQNLNEQPVEVNGNYYLYPLEETNVKESSLKETGFKKASENPVATGTFTSNKEMTLDWKNLPSGTYMLKAVAKDSQGKEVETEAQTILFSIGDKRPPVKSPTWFYAENTEFDATRPAVFCFGTSEKDTYVMMNVFCGDKQLESKALNLSDTIVRFTYPYLESYGDGIFVNFCMVRDGQLYQEQVSVEKRLADKTLTMKWEVFRDKLRPGQKEEWKLTIKTPQGQAADAEMLATMYDTSLDKIWNRRQDFRLYYNRILPNFRWMNGYLGNNSFNYWWNNKTLKVPVLAYDYFVMPSRIGNVFFESEILADRVMIRGVGVQKKAAMTGSVASRSNVVEVKYVPALVSEATDAKFEEATLPDAPADLRTNLAETAFFYPQLRTNEQGEISFSFTMPESLTRWNFR